VESEGLKTFLLTVGDAVYSLNTICVGLSGLGTGLIEKPDDLTITWETSNPKHAAIKARQYAVKSSLVFVEEALLQYISYLSQNPALDVGFRKSLAVEGAAEKVRNLSKEANFPEEYWSPIIVLLVRWRNQVVHGSKSRLKEIEVQALIRNKDKIYEAQSKTNIEETLQNFDAGRITLKDVSTMIAVTIKTLRYVDEKLNLSITTIEQFEQHIKYVEKQTEYNNIIKANGEETIKRKFFNFIATNFSTIDAATRDHLFSKRRVLEYEPSTISGYS
jgi:hypothetical protein